MFSVKTNNQATATSPNAILLRPPRAADGSALSALVDACPPLDANSRYCNLLHCTHFAATSVAAELDGRLVGFISAYLPPPRLDTLFVWQVAVHPDARGAGQGRAMLRHLLARPACSDVRYLDTTVTADNAASEAMFRGLARDLGARVRRHRWFDRDRHFGGNHASEYLLRIGPFDRAALFRSGVLDSDPFEICPTDADAAAAARSASHWNTWRG